MWLLNFHYEAGKCKSARFYWASKIATWFKKYNNTIGAPAYKITVSRCDWMPRPKMNLYLYYIILATLLIIFEMKCFDKLCEKFKQNNSLIQMFLKFAWMFWKFPWKVQIIIHRKETHLIVFNALLLLNFHWNVSLEFFVQCSLFWLYTSMSSSQWSYFKNGQSSGAEKHEFISSFNDEQPTFYSDCSVIFSCILSLITVLQSKKMLCRPKFNEFSDNDMCEKLFN